MTRKLTIYTRIFSVVVLLISSALIVMAQNPVPFISQPLVPDAIAPSAPGGPGFTFTLAVSGTGFVPGSKVNWNGSPRTTAFVDHSRLIAFILSSDIARPSTASITVVSPAPGGGTSNAVFLPIHDPSSTLAFRRTDYFVGGNPQFAATADFNRDGKLGLSGCQLRLRLGFGPAWETEMGHFRARTITPPVAMLRYRSLGISTGTGNSMSPCPTGRVRWLCCWGAGTAHSNLRLATRSAVLAIHGITADFNGDGKLDLAIVTWVRVFPSCWVTGMVHSGRSVDYPVGSEPTQVAAGDFNRDGKLDLVISNCGSNTVSILLGNGDGTFRAHIDYSTGNNPGGVAVADLNGDGKLDLVVPNQGSGTVSVLLGNGDGTFRPHVDYPAPHSGKIEVADFNQDGKLDLVVAGGNSVDILLGNGDGTFQPASSFQAGTELWDAVPADFNGDGRLDIAIGNWDDGTVKVLLATAVH